MTQQKPEPKNPLLRGMGYGILFAIPIWTVIIVLSKLAVGAL